MPYRGETRPRIACSAHAAAEAVGSCTRCHVALCDPCTLYFGAEPYCRSCVVGARRAWAARIAGGVAAVMLAMSMVSALMLAAIPAHVRARQPPPPVRHLENCRPFDQWIAEARRDLVQRHPRGALHDLQLSRRDCGYDPERDRIEALAYQQLGDKFAAIAAAARYAQARPGDEADHLLDRVGERSEPADVDPF